MTVTVTRVWCNVPLFPLNLKPFICTVQPLKKNSHPGSHDSGHRREVTSVQMLNTFDEVKNCYYREMAFFTVDHSWSFHCSLLNKNLHLKLRLFNVLLISNYLPLMGPHIQHIGLCMVLSVLLWLGPSLESLALESRASNCSRYAMLRYIHCWCHRTWMALCWNDGDSFLADLSKQEDIIMFWPLSSCIN